MNRLARIGISLVRKYFPELRTERIHFEIRPTNDDEGGMFYAEDRDNIGHHIIADNKTATLPQPILIGWTAHELVHCVQQVAERAKGTLPKEIRRKTLRPQFKQRNERETDEEVVRRGLGEYLFACNSYIAEKNDRWYPEFGLHPSEIRAILNGTLKTPHQQRYT